MIKVPVKQDRNNTTYTIIRINLIPKIAQLLSDFYGGWMVNKLNIRFA